MPTVGRPLWTAVQADGEGWGQWLVPHGAVRNLLIAQRPESLTAT